MQEIVSARISCQAKKNRAKIDIHITKRNYLFTMKFAWRHRLEHEKWVPVSAFLRKVENPVLFLLSAKRCGCVQLKLTRLLGYLEFLLLRVYSLLSLPKVDRDQGHFRPLQATAMSIWPSSSFFSLLLLPRRHSLSPVLFHILTFWHHARLYLRQSWRHCFRLYSRHTKCKTHRGRLTSLGQSFAPLLSWTKNPVALLFCSWRALGRALRLLFWHCDLACLTHFGVFYGPKSESTLH